MMMWDKKRQIETIMQRRKAGGGEVIAGPAPMKHEKVKDENGAIDPRHLAAQDMLAALHEKSPEKLMHAMGNFLELHSSAGSQPEPKE